jgi:hypothetical protein
MESLDKRIAQRREREEARLASGLAMDPNPSDHAGEAQDPTTFENLGNGTGALASTGASGALGNPLQPDVADAKSSAADKAPWPAPAGDVKAKTQVKGGSGSKDPTA